MFRYLKQKQIGMLGKSEFVCYIFVFSYNKSHYSDRIRKFCIFLSLRKTYVYPKFFWSAFSLIRTRKNPNTDTFCTFYTVSD